MSVRSDARMSGGVLSCTPPLGQPLGRVVNRCGRAPSGQRVRWPDEVPSGSALLDVEVIAGRIWAVVPILLRIELTIVISLDQEMETAIRDLGHDHQTIDKSLRR